MMMKLVMIISIKIKTIIATMINKTVNKLTKLIDHNDN